MEILCPECMGPVERATDVTGRCTLHGGVFRILFVRPAPGLARAEGSESAASAPAGGPEPAVSATGCRRHPEAESRFSCQECGAPLCAACARPQENGTVVCPDCAAPGILGLGRPRPAAARPAAPCPRHPEVMAVSRCANCNTPLCPTCDFVFPGDVHFCPDCATAPGETVSGRRRNRVIWSYALALWSTVAFLALFVVASLSGGGAGAEAAVGTAFMVVVLVPCVSGVALAVSAMEHQRARPFWVWAAAAWNGLILAGFLLTAIAGALLG